MKTSSDAPAHYSLAEAEAWASGYEAAKTEPITVYTATYSHKHGDDTCAFRSVEGGGSLPAEHRP